MEKAFTCIVLYSKVFTLASHSHVYTPMTAAIMQHALLATRSNTGFSILTKQQSPGLKSGTMQKCQKLQFLFCPLQAAKSKDCQHMD